MGKSELSRIKAQINSAPFVSPAVNSKLSVADEAQTRKERIRALDAEKKPFVSDLDQEADEMAKAALAKAKRQQEEQEDDIKKMNQFIAEAKCMGVREAQMREKKMMVEVLKQEESRLDAIMEANRQRSIRESEEKEAARKRQILAGAEVIQQQIESRHESALLEAEKKERNIQKMLDDLRVRNERDQVAREQQSIVKKQHLTDILRANQESIERKKLDKQKSKDEDIKIVEYLVEKAKKEELKQKEEEKRKMQKELEFAKMRAQQEKMGDMRAVRDELNAKRSAEEHERQWRAKEKLAAAQKRKQQQELAEVREAQKVFKEHSIAVEALKARMEFESIFQTQKSAEKRLEGEKQTKLEKSREFSEAIRSQIENRESQKKQAKSRFLEDGLKFQQTLQAQKSRLDAIKERKLDEMRKLGISETHCNEIMRKMALLDKQKFSK
eukprot:Partr_v1_DN25098_c0_g1_i3_m51002 putative coiled-coil domain containing 19